DFVATAYLDGGWPAVNAIWANPPTSTSQILHPEKYRAGQQPIRPDLPDLEAMLGSGWSEIDDDNLGELDLRTLIEQYVDRPTADRVMARWAGDHYKLLQ